MTPRRRALLRDLADVARQLADDELHVLVTIAVRAWIGQSRYGCLDLRHDRRDFRREAFEEVADALFYAAAELLTAGRMCRRPDRRSKLVHKPRGIAPVGTPRRQRHLQDTSTKAARRAPREEGDEKRR